LVTGLEVDGIADIVVVVAVAVVAAVGVAVVAVVAAGTELVESEDSVGMSFEQEVAARMGQVVESEAVAGRTAVVEAHIAVAAVHTAGTEPVAAVLDTLGA
jgi:hypothetical protein